MIIISIFTSRYLYQTKNFSSKEVLYQKNKLLLYRVISYLLVAYALKTFCEILIVY